MADILMWMHKLESNGAHIRGGAFDTLLRQGDETRQTTTIMQAENNDIKAK